MLASPTLGIVAQQALPAQPCPASPASLQGHSRLGTWLVPPPPPKKKEPKSQNHCFYKLKHDFSIKNYVKPKELQGF